MIADRDWMGPFVEVSPKVWEAFHEGFGFHDAVFDSVDFPEDGDPRLYFDAALVVGSRIQRIRVVATLLQTSELAITKPKDWIYKFEATPFETGCVFRWIDSETGYPVIEAKAAKLEIELVI